MKKTFFIICSFVFFLASCSSNDSPNQTIQPSFTVIGESEGVYYQSDFDPSRDEISLTDLSDQLNLNLPNFRGIDFVEDIVSFNNVRGDELTIWQKELETVAIKKYELFLTIDEQFLWNTLSPMHIYIGYESPRNSGDVYLRIIDRQDESVSNVYLTTVTRANLFGKPMYHSDKLNITFSNDGIYQTIVFNPNTQQIDDTLVYDGTPTVLKNTNGNLSVFDSNNFYFEYDLLTLTKLNERTLGTIPNFIGFGNLSEPIVHNDVVYHKKPAAQPSFLLFNPAIFDINSQQSTIIDINQNTNIPFEPIQGTRFAPVTITYDKVNDIFLVGFVATYSDGAKGVMIFNKNRKLINAIELPFSPLKILLR